MLHSHGLRSGLDSVPEESLPQAFTFIQAVQAIHHGQTIARSVQQLLSEMTKKERLALLDGDVPFWDGMRGILCDRYNREPFVHGAIPRLSIPGIKFTDGPRGIVMGYSTAFPVSMSRGASWDVELERRIGEAIGLEGRAQGANFFAGICINLPRHPAWGRIQETYGEDPMLLGEFGLALHTGVREHLMTCVKHFALNSMENARFRVDVEVDDAALHEVYLPHFKRVIEGGVSSVMSSYNSVRGEWAGQNEELLTVILRDQWRFDGFVLSDFIFGLRNSALSLKNGLDIEAPFRQQRAMHLEAALESGELEWVDVDKACIRILRKQLEHVVRTGTSTPDMSAVFSDKHRLLAREAAAKGMVLLKNEPVRGKPLLPISTGGLGKVGVIGRLANSHNTGDKGSSAVFAPQVVTAYEGIKAALPNFEVLLEDSDSVERATDLASQVDFVVCLLGYNATDEGEYVVPSFKDDPVLLDLFPPAYNEMERRMLAIAQGQGPVSVDNTSEKLVPGAGGDRKSLRLRSRDVEVVSAVTSVNSNVVATIVTAGAIVMEEWIDKVPALVMAWYSGCEGGHALADVLFGHVDASGRMPFSTPRCESHLPCFDIAASKVTYDRWFGQRLLDKLQEEARFPLGYGLSYTTFTASELRVDSSHLRYGAEEMMVSFTVANEGRRIGRHIAQIYGLPGIRDFPTRVLLGFTSTVIEVGQSVQVRCSASTRPLQRWTRHGFVMPENPVTIELSTYSGDPDSLRAVVEAQCSS